MNKKKDSELRKTALHEAGHCVAFIRLFPNRYGVSVTIVPNEGLDLLGLFLAESVDFPIGDSEPEMTAFHAELELQALCCCAGYAAMIAAGFSQQEAEEGCEIDFYNAKKFSRRPETSKKNAVDLMRQEKNIRAVGRIADELLIRKTIDYDVTEVLVDLIDGETTEEEYRLFVKFRYPALSD